jgi:hypothetical protein
MEEPFQRGELVTLRVYESEAEPLGRIVSVTADGQRAEVSWQPAAGSERRVTIEPTAHLRRVHESELSPDRRAG